MPEDVAEDVAGWAAMWKIEKYRGVLEEWPLDCPDLANLFAPAPYATLTIPGNLLTYGGASCLWQYALGNGTSTAAQTLTFLSNARACLGTGDSSTAASATQTDLQASSNKARVAMDATFPAHTDATSSGAASIVFQSTFGTGAGNYAWNELALFNASTGGRMINRKVIAGGTKTSADTWVLTLTITLA